MTKYRDIPVDTDDQCEHGVWRKEEPCEICDEIEEWCEEYGYYV